MDKLIDYEGLRTFHDSLLNDSSTSEKATWSSDKINTELTTGLAAKANASDVTTALEGKADLSYVNTELNKKTNKSYVDTELAKKQDYLNQTSIDNITLSNHHLNAKGYYYYDTKNSITQNSQIENSTKGGQYSISLDNSIGEGDYTIAEGNATLAFGNYSHSEGNNTSAIGTYSHAEGRGGRYTSTLVFSGAANATQYTTDYPHLLRVGAFLKYNGVVAKVTEVPSDKTFIVDRTLSSSAVSNKRYTVLDGLAYGESSHIEGAYTTAEGNYSHAEGFGGHTFSEASHVEGVDTYATNYAEHAEGSVNKSHKNSDVQIDAQHPNGDAGNTIHSIGIGYSYGVMGVPHWSEKNAVEVMQNGDAYIYGIGSYDGVHIKTETGYESTKTLQEVISGIDTSVSGKQDALTAGSNITISNNVISATDTTYSDATTSTSGLMSAADKTKLNSLVVYETATTADIEALFA